MAIRRPAGSARSYAQFCGVAAALDVVGSRWSLLVIRELLDGPMRYTDLLDGLPGVPTDLLAARLREFEEAGVVTRDVLPPPAASKVYRLTDDGRELEPVVLALSRWGLRRLPDRRHATFKLSWLAVALKSLFQPVGVRRATATVDFVVGGERMRATIDHGTLTFDHHPSGEPDAVIKADPNTLVAMAVDPAAAAAALARGKLRVSGTPDALATVRHAFGLDPGG
jgi:DNA-binding HxlR family transcriptional regulator